MYHILEQVSGKWRDIGRELRVCGKMLQTLQDANLPPEQCCNKVIEEWLMYSGDEPSWYSLTEALKRLDMKQDVDKIMTKWGKSVVVELLIKFTIFILVKPSNQLTGSVLAGPHVITYGQLKDEDISEEAITDAFLTIFAEVVKPYWNLLAPCIISTTYDLTEEDTLHQLQAWKEEKHPTYGVLCKCLNQHIFNPDIIPEDGRQKGNL